MHGRTQDFVLTAGSGLLTVCMHASFDVHVKGTGIADTRLPSVGFRS